MVEPPQARGHVVGEQNINAVVTPGQQEEDHPEQAGEEGGPVEEQVLGGGVCKYERLGWQTYNKYCIVT